MEAAGVPSGENGLLRASLPPPPPPPLPPPPRLLAPPGSLPSCHAARHSMKKLKWDTIPSQRVLGKSNVWTSRLPQRDLVLDISSMDKLFSRVDKWTLLQRSRLAGIKEHGGVEVGPQEPQVTILHSKRSMNIGIFLRQFKRPVAEMVEDIRQGNWCKFGSGKLKELCKMLPEESEVRQLLSFSGNLSLLPEADRFMVQLVQVPCYEELLKMMVLREEFLPLMAEVKNSLAVMIRAANELLDCDDLHAVIHLVLKAGNYMNAGGYNADAMGFRMTSLLNLADTKANTPGMNLMHYVAKQAEDIDAALLTFPGQMEHIAMALRICKEEVVADFEREVKKLKEVKLYTIRHPALFQQMETFFTQAEAQLSDVDFLLHELNVLSYAVAEYFCEDPTSFKLEECCSVFHSFCRNFDRAVQENGEREAAEQRRRRKESSRLATKRRSKVSDPGSEANLESVLRSFLANDLDGVSRCRKTLELAVRHPSGDKPEPASPESPEKEHQDAEKVSEEGRHGEGAMDSPATPRTPRPRTRDYFFAKNGDVGSPWTILSPLTCSQRRAQQHRTSVSDEDDDVWESGGDPPNPNPPSLSEYPRDRALSKSPYLRSASVDETRLSPAPAFRLGSFFQRSYSSGSRTESAMMDRARALLVAAKTGDHANGPANSLGFISFFRRFGGRSKTGDVEDHVLKDDDT
ncbi:FH2 domain-containing protein 1-like isoform X1 [Entelurus aequoreus]|uniref:FH2 domain-containing protein 1-like isoform X1 n=1 Tax=Entelurus aequoreus TaxID=161455 RepID=UPI002B1E0895|nr:FH2 domain-containing protein 1-like isoform X1 [Entelurus aequoreus]